MHMHSSETLTAESPDVLSLSYQAKDRLLQRVYAASLRTEIIEISHLRDEVARSVLDATIDAIKKEVLDAGSEMHYMGVDQYLNFIADQIHQRAQLQKM